MNEIIISNLKKNFRGKVVLDIPSFGSHSGEIVSIAKENDCKEIHLENLSWLESQGGLANSF